jgi:FAD/FMN-containing dehydrogenase
MTGPTDGKGGPVPASPRSLDGLRRSFGGEILLPDHPRYGESRTLFNAMIDTRPAIIAQCDGVEDVRKALRFGRDAGLPISVRGGGHGVAGRALVEGGMVLDLRRMNRVSVDPEARTVTVEGGATMSHMDRATEPHGLATTGGRVSSTGVAGYALGGGDGWLARKFGLACDNLLAVELITADGSLVRTSDDENPELFWALHGGGGNFGIATSLTFRLHDLPSVTVAFLVWPPEAGPQVLRTYRDFLEVAPDEVGGGVFYLTAPPEDFVPEELVGKLAFTLLLVYAGPEAEARRVVAPLLAMGHGGAFVGEMPNADLQCMFDDPPGYRNYWSAEYLDAFPDQAVDRFCARAPEMIIPSPSQHVLIPQGGALGREADRGHPLPWKAAPWCVHPFGLWEDRADDERGIQWTRDVRADMAPWATGDVYLNFIGEEGRDRVVAGFGEDNYARLARVKARYDPENVFRSNHNIGPDPSAAPMTAAQEG